MACHIENGLSGGQFVQSSRVSCIVRLSPKVSCSDGEASRVMTKNAVSWESPAVPPAVPRAENHLVSIHEGHPAETLEQVCLVRE